MNRHWHECFGFVARIAKHHPLIASTDSVNRRFFVAFIAIFKGAVNALRDVGALAGDGDLHAACVAIKPFAAAIVADASHNFAYQFVNIDIGGGGHLAKHHHETSFNGRFASNPRIRVLCHNGIQNSIADLVAHLVGMPFCH